MIRAQARAEHQDATGHSGYRGTTDETGRIVCTQCPWQYPPAETEPEAPPTDPEPAMGPIDDDPGPEPDAEPEAPPLTLRDRIHNAVDLWGADDDLIGRIGGDALEQLVEQLHASVGAGADWSPRVEGAAMTPAQALAYLLDLPEWARIDRLGRLIDQAEKAGRCFIEDHDGAMQMNLALQMSEARNRDALNRIGKLCTNLDGGETDLQNMIGKIAAEALVRRA